MKRILILYIFANLGICTNVNAQQNYQLPDNATRWQMLKYDTGSIFKGILYSYSRPFHWEQKQWLEFGGVVAGTSVLYIFDDQTSKYFRDQSNDIPQPVKDYGWYYGSPQNNYMLTGAVYLTGLTLKNEKLRRTGVLLIASASAAGLLQQTSKYIFGRARPRSGDDKNTFYPFTTDKDYHSFPSGHAILAFTNAYAIAKQFKSPWIKGGLYTIGLVPGVSRLWEGAHWLTDVVVGVAISIATVEAIDKYLDSRYDEKYNQKNKQYSWNLSFPPGRLGVTIVF
ncbi:phosphatase PAP2 family protein [Galbibacter pacificus]|uniref:Phosphatase PAP2 family protein n=1 Tax=Galbibacter pacificus TaxID=2996052 RepID=A0ABT6FVD5_9FLAO|nr:phosphatase PAP2 family protein [Galbibacter pacificus]MDG3583882.1 phosphatase PAP2 family protein [Galbibacter pacificus]MDG3587200.1 phosphatase PAP2 family protein [Galbibacter pacificus]